MKKFIILTVMAFCLAPVQLLAEEDNFKFIAGMKGGLYLDKELPWAIEPYISWQFQKYVGVSLGLEITRQYNQSAYNTTINGHEAVLTGNDRNIGWIIFKPSVIFKSPVLLKANDDNVKLWAQMEPGINVGCPTRNSLTYEIIEFHGYTGKAVDYRKYANHGLKCVFWNTNASINLSIDRVVIGGGYSISNFDYYSGRRNVTLEDGSKFRVPKKALGQTIFLKIGFMF